MIDAEIETHLWLRDVPPPYKNNATKAYWKALYSPINFLKVYTFIDGFLDVDKSSARGKHFCSSILPSVPSLCV